MDRRFEEGLVWPRWAVERWAEFPIGQNPRPLVLVGPDVFAEFGFRSGEAKDAYLEGRFEILVPLPAPVSDALRGARERLVPARPPQAPLPITEATHVGREFRTDRGPVWLPAWRLASPSALGPIWVLDPDVAQTRWRPRGSPTIPRPDLQIPLGDPGARSELDEDGRTLTVHVLGGTPQVERYTGAETIESSQAVAVVPVGEDIGPPGWRTLAGYLHDITIPLQSPLGARVHVDLHGNLVEVRVQPGPG